MVPVNLTFFWKYSTLPTNCLCLPLLKLMNCHRNMGGSFFIIFLIALGPEILVSFSCLPQQNLRYRYYNKQLSMVYPAVMVGCGEIWTCTSNSVTLMKSNFLFSPNVVTTFILRVFSGCDGSSHCTNSDDSCPYQGRCQSTWSPLWNWRSLYRNPVTWGLFKLLNNPIKFIFKYCKYWMVPLVVLCLLVLTCWLNWHTMPWNTNGRIL
jgi:hypothetical protein